MPESAQRSIQAWPAQATVAAARTAGLGTLRRISWRNTATEASVAIQPVAFAHARPSMPSRIAAAIHPTQSGLVQP